MVLMSDSVMTTSDPWIGKKVGNYVLKKHIGHGGMGSVYVADHPQILKQVAVKLLSAEYTLHAEFVERFVAEARAVAHLNHPNIISIFDFGLAITIILIIILI